MAFFNRIKKSLFLTFILTALMTLSVNAYDVKGGEVKVGSSLNLRSEASTSASVVTQIPNTHRVAVLDAIDGWYKVAYNGQNGFVSADYVELSDIMNVQPGAAKITTDILNVRSAPSTSGDIVTRLSKGTTAKIIGINTGWFKIELASGATGYIHPDYVEVVANSVSSTAASSGTAASGSVRSQVVDYASTFLGVPYVYGGGSPKGFDCSGFTSYVYKHFNVSLPHSSASQYTRVSKVSRDNLQPGDLVFFASSAGGSRINHVGIYVGNGNFIHAPRPGKVVCYDSLYSSYYSSHYVGAGTVY
ncbi:MAG: C40 family peptidase [Clostridia bacterium]|nr:C40 family peptidase [Clostridia bacterium]MBQ3091958.1 C40 family peptidase [Clostridia bacterium]